MVLLMGFVVASTAFDIPAQADNVPSKQSGIDQEQMQRLQNRMLSDAQVMALISALQNDPDMQVLLNDPAFLQAVGSQDIEKLANDPRFIKLFSNPRVMEIIKRVGQ